MTAAEQVAQHYRRGSLEQAILDALRAAGKDVERLDAADLSAVDEFHLGWHAATVELGRDLGLAEGMHVLDAGAGIGGPARHFAASHGCRVTGIDLTDEYVSVANALTRRCGLAERARFIEASALAMPFDAGSFDAATLIHVGMNIAEKAALFAEVRRVLKGGGRFAVYDIMRVGAGAIAFPTPWAATAATSFVEPPDTYRKELAAAGFVIETEIDRRDFVMELARDMREAMARHGAPALGLHVLIGPATPERLGNIFSALESGTIAPVEMLARAA